MSPQLKVAPPLRRGQGKGQLGYKNYLLHKFFNNVVFIELGQMELKGQYFSVEDLKIVNFSSSILIREQLCKWNKVNIAVGEGCSKL